MTKNQPALRVSCFLATFKVLSFSDIEIQNIQSFFCKNGEFRHFQGEKCLEIRIWSKKLMVLIQMRDYVTSCEEYFNSYRNAKNQPFLLKRLADLARYYANKC